MAHKIVSGLLGTTLLALFLTGCESPAAQPEAPTPKPTSGSTTTFTDGLLTYERTRVDGGYAGNTAEKVGTISFENGCLLVGGAPMVFPADVTSWDGTTLTVNGFEYVVGDAIAVGGGQDSGTRVPENIPEQCGDLTPWYASGVNPNVVID